MPKPIVVRLLLGHSALISLGGLSAAAQTVDLPQITVTAPSPIVRRNPPAQRPATPGPGAGPRRAAAAPPTPIAPPVLQGALPIVTDQFATVTVVPKEELDRSAGRSLGDVLSDKPGITSSSFAPGTASRPVIRGLDNNRVRIQENGLSVGDVSDLGEDHAVPLDPLAAQQIEVIRGPATLRYGSQSIGGVVSVDNNRIPTTIPLRGFAVEISGAANSADNGRDGSVLIDAGKGNYAFHADAFARRSENYSIPISPFRFNPAQPFDGKQPNSYSRSNGQSVGGSYIFAGGYAGVALTQFNALYAIPGIGSADSNTRLDVRQIKVTSKGEYRPDASAIDTVRFWLSATDYKHNELGLSNGLDGVQQTFTNKSQEARIEVQLAPFNLRFASLTTALGIQGANQDLTGPGAAGGLFDPNNTKSIAGYVFNELKFTDTFRMQVSGRIESVNVTGSTPDLFVDPTVSLQRDLKFTPKSGAVGFLQDLPYDLVASLTGQYVERAPRASELLSRGPHDATATFDVGNPNLKTEVAKSVEIGLRRSKGPFRFEATAYRTRFDGFIYRRLTGLMCDDDFASCGAGTELNQAVYSQNDAIFQGAEVQAQYDVAQLGDGLWGIDARYDRVRANFTDGSNVPRIPPQRYGGGLYWRSAAWFARVSVLHADAQNDVAQIAETPTDGYNLLKAELTRTETIKNPNGGPRVVTFGMVGNNLLNEPIRNAVSFTKDEVLLPGRSVRVFAKVAF